MALSLTPENWALKLFLGKDDMSDTKIKVDQAILKKLMMEESCPSGKFEGHRAQSNEGRMAATGFYVGFRCDKCKQMVWLDRDKVMDREPDPRATPDLRNDYGPLAGLVGVNNVVAGTGFPKVGAYTGKKICDPTRKTVNDKLLCLVYAYGPNPWVTHTTVFGDVRYDLRDTNGVNIDCVYMGDHHWYQFK